MTDSEAVERLRQQAATSGDTIDNPAILTASDARAIIAALDAMQAAKEAAERSAHIERTTRKGWEAAHRDAEQRATRAEAALAEAVAAERARCEAIVRAMAGQPKCADCPRFEPNLSLNLAADAIAAGAHVEAPTVKDCLTPDTP